MISKKSMLLLTACTAALLGAGAFMFSSIAQNKALAQTSSAPIGSSSPSFTNQSTVTVDAFFTELKAQIPLWADAPAVKQDYQQFLKQYALSDSPTLYQDYVRVLLAFEATRAGGLWGNAWNVTDQLPQSDKVWHQWQQSAAKDILPTTTAVAECDELSALFAVVAHGIGLSKDSTVGLLWPTSNHTVAVWIPNNASAKPVRVVVPTSQIFLDGEQSLGTTAFDPWKQKVIYDYRRVDVSKETKLPASLARAMISAVQKNAHLSQKELQTQRNQREQLQRQS
jgi:hypothetical protein